MSFVNLHLHTDASKLDGIIKIEELIDFTIKNNMPAVAITDHGNMANTISFLKTIKEKGNKIKGIVGQEFYLVDDLTSRGDDPFKYHLVLLAKNQTGYKNLLKLTTLANTTGFYYKPTIDLKHLTKHKEGLICLSACLQGKVAKAILFEHALKNQIPLDDEHNWRKNFLNTVMFKSGQKPHEVIKEFTNIFKDDFYLEIQINGIADQNIVNKEQLKLSETLGIPTVLTSDAHYLYKKDRDIQDLVFCNSMQKRVTDITKKQWLQLSEEQKKKTKFRLSFEGTAHALTPKLVQEILEEFPELKSSVENTIKISDQCEQITIQKKYSLPDLSTKTESADTILEGKAKWGLLNKFKLDQSTAHKLPKEYKDRIEHELSIIKELGFANYFLIVSDYCTWSRKNNILYGAGRGSGVSSLVLYSLGITKIDPIKYNLLFSRFLNKGRKDSLPDIDLDWGSNDGPKIVTYLKERYGEDKVTQICTYGPLHAKSAIKDICKVMNYPYMVGEFLSNSIPLPGRGKTPSFEFAKKSKEYMKFRTQVNSQGQLMINRTITLTAKEVNKIFDAAERIEGIKKSTSIHAGGVIISGDPISDRCPLQHHGNELISQYDMEGCEATGLVKFDILKVSAIQTLANTLNSIYTYEGTKLELEDIPLDDPETYKLYQEGNIAGVFQFDSSNASSGKSMMNLGKEIGIEKIEELFDVIALFRPGILDNKLDELYVKNKKKERNKNANNKKPKA